MILTLVGPIFPGFPYGPLAALKDSELWAPV